MTRRPAPLVAVIALALALAASCAGRAHPTSPTVDPYGGPPPGAPAVRFAPDAVSDGATFSAAFTPGGRTVFVSRRGPGRVGARLFTARFESGAWTSAVPGAVTVGRANRPSA